MSARTAVPMSATGASASALEEFARAAQRRRTRALCVVRSLAVAPWLVLLSLRLSGHLGGERPWVILGLAAGLSWFLYTLAHIMADWSWDARHISRLREMVAALDDPRAVGCLLEIMAAYPEIADVSHAALERLLPSMSQDQGWDLSRRQFRSLADVLAPWSEAPYALKETVLEALARISDYESIEVVREVATREGDASHDGELAARARVHLPAMRERLAAIERTGDLLRPAQSPRDDTLLRPAGGAPAAHEERLVRPADEDAA